MFAHAAFACASMFVSALLPKSIDLCHAKIDLCGLSSPFDAAQVIPQVELSRCKYRFS